MQWVARDGGLPPPQKKKSSIDMGTTAIFKNDHHSTYSED